MVYYLRSKSIKNKMVTHICINMAAGGRCQGLTNTIKSNVTMCKETTHFRSYTFYTVYY